MKKVIILAVLLSGCASGQTEYYAAETARHKAEEARWGAMAKIAESGGDTVKAVAMVTMGIGAKTQSQQTVAPRSGTDTALQIASVFVPALVQGYSITANMKTSMRLSDNSVALAQSSNNAFVGIAGKIQAPIASQTSSVTNNDSHNITGSYNPSTESHAITDSYNPSTVSTDSHAVTSVPAPTAVATQQP